MELFSQLFGKREKKQSPDVSHLGRLVANKVDTLVMDIFNAHQGRLCFEPAGFIVPAVWGDQERGELAPVQAEIHRKVAPAIDEMIQSLEFKKISDEQAYAIGLMLRWIVISKITYMVELRKKRGMDPLGAAPAASYHLDSMDPLGSC